MDTKPLIGQTESCVRTVADSKSGFGKIRLQSVKPVPKREGLYKPGSLSFSSVSRPLILDSDRKTNSRRNRFDSRCCDSEQCSDISTSTTSIRDNGFTRRRLCRLENKFIGKESSGRVYKVCLFSRLS